MYGLGWKWGLRRKSPRLIEDVSVGLKLPHDALHDLLLESPVQNQLFWNIAVNRNVQKRLLYKWVLNLKAHAQLWMAPTKNAFNTINPFRKIKGLNHLTRLLYFTMHCPEKHLFNMVQLLNKKHTHKYLNCTPGGSQSRHFWHFPDHLWAFRISS